MTLNTLQLLLSIFAFGLIGVKSADVARNHPDTIDAVVELLNFYNVSKKKIQKDYYNWLEDADVTDLRGKQRHGTPHSIKLALNSIKLRTRPDDVSQKFIVPVNDFFMTRTSRKVLRYFFRLTRLVRNSCSDLCPLPVAHMEVKQLPTLLID